MEHQKDWRAYTDVKQQLRDRDDLHQRLTVEALDLVAELWPKPGFATVHLESHQWERLRRFLLAVPELGDLP